MHVHIHTHTCIHIYMWTYTYTYTYIHTWIHTHTNTHIHVHIHIYIYICLCTHIYIYIYIYRICTSCREREANVCADVHNICLTFSPAHAWCATTPVNACGLSAKKCIWTRVCAPIQIHFEMKAPQGVLDPPSCQGPWYWGSCLSVNQVWVYLNNHSESWDRISRSQSNQ